MKVFSKFKKHNVILAIFLFAVVLSCSACISGLPYSAKLFDKAEKWLTEEFLTENKTHYPFAIMKP